MIEIDISGSMPVFNTDFSAFTEKAADIMFRSVQDNFLMGGRPDTWAPLATGEASHLYRSGYLFENIQLQWDAFKAVVSLDTGRVYYAPFLQYGTKKMPARPFMIFQEQDKERILKEYGDSIFSNKPITFSQ